MYCTEVDLDRGVMKAISQHCGKMHEGLLVHREKTALRTKTAIKMTEINVVMLCGLVHTMSRENEALGEEMAPVTSRALRRSGGAGVAARSA